MTASTGSAWTRQLGHILARPVKRLRARWRREEIVSGAEGASKDAWSESFKNLMRRLLYRCWPTQAPEFECPVCGYVGRFKDKSVRHGPRWRRRFSKCVGCGAAERHRMIHLVIDELFGAQGGQSLLHVAPELCLQPQLRDVFKTYHTSDLYLPDVDFQEDLQAMSFAAGSYDAVLVSRVLMIPPDLCACLDEIRRILKPGGLALIAEAFHVGRTEEFSEMRRGESRRLGSDLVGQLEQRFSSVELYRSDRYDGKYQLTNLIEQAGRAHDEFPDAVRAEGRGYHEVVAVCRA